MLKPTEKGGCHVKNLKLNEKTGEGERVMGVNVTVTEFVQPELKSNGRTLMLMRQRTVRPHDLKRRLKQFDPGEGVKPGSAWPGLALILQERKGREKKKPTFPIPNS